MPPVARVYVAVTIAAGALCLTGAAAGLRFEHPGLFGLLLVLAMATSAAKIELPLGRSQSNLSLSHAVNFWALFALGPAEAVVHRDGERLGPVHVARWRPQPACTAFSSTSDP